MFPMSYRIMEAVLLTLSSRTIASHPLDTALWGFRLEMSDYRPLTFWPRSASTSYCMLQDLRLHVSRPVPEARMIRKIKPYHPGCQCYRPTSRDGSTNMKKQLTKQNKQRLRLSPRGDRGPGCVSFVLSCFAIIWPVGC